MRTILMPSLAGYRNRAMTNRIYRKWQAGEINQDEYVLMVRPHNEGPFQVFQGSEEMEGPTSRGWFRKFSSSVNGVNFSAWEMTPEGLAEQDRLYAELFGTEFLSREIGGKYA